MQFPIERTGSIAGFGCEDTYFGCFVYPVSSISCSTNEKGVNSRGMRKGRPVLARVLRIPFLLPGLCWMRFAGISFLNMRVLLRNVVCPYLIPVFFCGIGVLRVVFLYSDEIGKRDPTSRVTFWKRTFSCASCFLVLIRVFCLCSWVWLYNPCTTS